LSSRLDRRHDEIIISTANPLIKYIRSLQRRKTRYQERAFVIEGFRAIDEALAAGVSLQTVLIREDVDVKRIDPRLQAFPIRVVSDAAFRTVTNVEFPQGILAVAPMPAQSDVKSWFNRTSLALIADGIRDPGNLGTLLRSASAAGVDYVVMADESVDPYNPKVVRSAMGAHFQIPVYRASASRLNQVMLPVEQIVIADASGDVDYDEVEFTRSTGIVIGGEAFGPLGHLEHENLVHVRIPLVRSVESLNAGVAGSLLMFEAARQRRLQAKSSEKATFAG
jgi:TrmH family RNA methyltransferase